MANKPIAFPAQIDLASFISHHAHDLRSPYNRIMGFSKIMLKGQSGPLTDFQKEDLSTVHNSGVHAFTMVNNLIEIARLQTGQKQLKIAPVEIDSLLAQAITQWAKYHPDQAVEIQAELDPAVSHIQADDIQLAQALTCLLTCAIEYIQPPGVAFLKAARRDDQAIFSAQSQGISARNPSAADVEMYGYIAQELIKLHGGELIQQEMLEDGAVIVFEMPIVQPGG